MSSNRGSRSRESPPPSSRSMSMSEGMSARTTSRATIEPPDFSSAGVLPASTLKDLLPSLNEGLVTTTVSVNHRLLSSVLGSLIAAMQTQNRYLERTRTEMEDTCAQLRRKFDETTQKMESIMDRDTKRIDELGNLIVNVEVSCNDKTERNSEAITATKRQFATDLDQLTADVNATIEETNRSISEELDRMAKAYTDAAFTEIKARKAGDEVIKEEMERTVKEVLDTKGPAQPVVDAVDPEQLQRVLLAIDKLRVQVDLQDQKLQSRALIIDVGKKADVGWSREQLSRKVDVEDFMKQGKALDEVLSVCSDLQKKLDASQANKGEPFTRNLVTRIFAGPTTPAAKTPGSPPANLNPDSFVTPDHLPDGRLGHPPGSPGVVASPTKPGRAVPTIYSGQPGETIPMSRSSDTGHSEAGSLARSGTAGTLPGSPGAPVMPAGSGGTASAGAPPGGQGVPPVPPLASGPLANMGTEEFIKVLEEAVGQVAGIAAAEGTQAVQQLAEQRLDNIYNELFRMEKSKADRVELEEWVRSTSEAAEDAATSLRYRCLSCNRTSGSLVDRSGTKKSMNEFPPSQMFISSLGQRQRDASSVMGSEVGSKLQDTVQQGSVGPRKILARKRRKAGEPSVSTITPSMRGPSPDPQGNARHKLENLYQYLKGRHQEEVIKHWSTKSFELEPDLVDEAYEGEEKPGLKDDEAPIVGEGEKTTPIQERGDLPGASAFGRDGNVYTTEPQTAPVLSRRSPQPIGQKVSPRARPGGKAGGAHSTPKGGGKQTPIPAKSSPPPQYVAADLGQSTGSLPLPDTLAT